MAKSAVTINWRSQWHPAATLCLEPPIIKLIWRSPAQAKKYLPAARPTLSPALLLHGPETLQERNTEMTAGTPSLTSRPAWKSLAAHHEKLAPLHLRQLFADDPQRGERMTLEAEGLFLDYSKNRITGETLRLLAALAEECGLRARIDAMFRGEKINITEHRAVLHVIARCGAATRGGLDHGRRRECRSWRACRARQDGRVRQSHPQRRVEGSHLASGFATS